MKYLVSTIAILISAFSIFGQNVEFRGKFKDRGDGLVAGVVVEISEIESGHLIATSKSDGDGAFRFELPVGVYALSAKAIGFLPIALKRIEVRADSLFDQDFVFKVQEDVVSCPVSDTSSIDTLPSVVSKENEIVVERPKGDLPIPPKGKVRKKKLENKKL